MGGKFAAPAGKHCWKIADGLSEMVDLPGLRCWLTDWRIRDATVDVVSCSATASTSKGARCTAAGTRS